ncbi:gamma-butyrobetaine dioxygenase protein [Colletotrichum incanum]|uniref:Gamma-butyrobetaine dioxygenase protein n=1 Tax=Colletotrichum incanum TaxID=1573173 RepID=A0A161YBM0_COLIC|nr:gamma-butyrobetaine dioxygenase protein [Colletotrichum incanum]
MEKNLRPTTPSDQIHPMITGIDLSVGGTVLKVSFRNSTSSFHAQWLWDARCDKSSSRTAGQAFCQTPSTMRIREANVLRSGIATSLEITWMGDETAVFPAIWLRVLSSVVAMDPQKEASEYPFIPRGWLSQDLIVPEITFKEIMEERTDVDKSSTAKTTVLDTLLLDSEPGIIKVTNLPSVDPSSESSQKDNLLTMVLKQLFGSVFQHPRRGPDETFKIASHYHASSSQAVELPNYDTSELLLPHTDHSHYNNPVRVQGLHAVEGSTENTFINAFSVLTTLVNEDKDMYDALCKAPMIMGRKAEFYDPPLKQTTVDTAVRMMAGTLQTVNAIRWHPHLAGYLLSPFEKFESSRAAHSKFQEIMRRDSHMFRTTFKPGDLYLWDNFRILHGRERTLNTPRLAIGQTVTEQTASDVYREVKVDQLRGYVDEDWLVQTPTFLLNEMLGIISAEL